MRRGARVPRIHLPRRGCHSARRKGVATPPSTAPAGPPAPQLGRASPPQTVEALSSETSGGAGETRTVGGAIRGCVFRGGEREQHVPDSPRSLFLSCSSRARRAPLWVRQRGGGRARDARERESALCVCVWSPRAWLGRVSGGGREQTDSGERAAPTDLPPPTPLSLLFGRGPLLSRVRPRVAAAHAPPSPPSSINSNGRRRGLLPLPRREGRPRRRGRGRRGRRRVRDLVRGGARRGGWPGHAGPAEDR